MKLTFDVIDNVLKRTDKEKIINRNKNIYKAVFNFQSTDENENLWLEDNIFVIFEDSWNNKTTVHLGKDNLQLSAIIPSFVLEGTYFRVSVYAGDLISTNTVSIPLSQSGYERHHHNHCGGSRKDIFVELFDKLDSKIDDIAFSDNCLHFYSGGELIDSIYLDFADETSVRKWMLEYINDFQTELERKADRDHEHNVVSGTSPGFMSVVDKIKLDTIEYYANKVIVDDELNLESENPISNEIVANALSGKADKFDFVDELNKVFEQMLD